MNLDTLPTKSISEWIDVALILPDQDRTLFWLLIGAICARSPHWAHVDKLWSTGSIEGSAGYDRARQLLRQWKADQAFKERLDLGA